MDKISLLLQEAKPLYLKRERNKKIASSCLLSVFLCLFLVWQNTSQPIAFDEDAFDSYVTALYDDNIIKDEEIPIDIYDLYEV